MKTKTHNYMGYLISVEKDKLEEVANKLIELKIEVWHKFPVLGILFVESSSMNVELIKEQVEGIMDIKENEILFGFKK